MILIELRLKKKSHHYIEPPSPENDPNWIPIEMNDYEKCILIQQNAPEDGVDDVREAIKDEFPSIEFKVTLNKGWFLVRVEKASFNDFHHAISFCSIIEENVLGYCKHQSNASENYIVKVDNESDLDYMIGVFQNGDNFGIFLPKSKLHPKGNISKSNVSEMSFEEEFNKIKDLIN